MHDSIISTTYQIVDLLNIKNEKIYLFHYMSNSRVQEEHSEICHICIDDHASTYEPYHMFFSIKMLQVLRKLAKTTTKNVEIKIMLNKDRYSLKY